MAPNSRFVFAGFTSFFDPQGRPTSAGTKLFRDLRAIGKYRLTNAVSTADVDEVTTADATDAAETMALVNELKASLNETIEMANDLKEKLNTLQAAYDNQWQQQ